MNILYIYCVSETRPEKESDLVINKKYKLPSANDTTSSNEHILHSTTPLSFSTSHFGTDYEVSHITDKANSSNQHRASDMTSRAILVPERIDAKLFNTRSSQLSTGEHSRYTPLQSSNKPVMCLSDLTIIRHLVHCCRGILGKVSCRSA